MSANLEAELASAKRRIAELERKLANVQQKQGQHRAQLVGSVHGRDYLYSLVVEYDWCKRKWGYWAHQMHRRPPIVRSGFAKSYEEAKSMVQEVTRQWCEERKWKPDFTKLGDWKCFPREL